MLWRISSPSTSLASTPMFSRSSSVLVEKEFATLAYQSALSSLELARTDGLRQHRYLALIAEPSLPDEAMFPRRWLSLLTTFIASLVLFGVLSLSFSAIKEHAKL
jgi:capsular polysaccharide transport system permease protein